jgi:hypothetical protein
MELSYKKARTLEPEVEPCRLISASALEDVENENVHKIKGGYCPESSWS